jgi:Helix-turn-helix domain
MTGTVEIHPPTPSWTGSMGQAAWPASFGSFEPFVDERIIARFLQIAPRRVLEMARKGELPSHPIGRTRKTWRFRVSEVARHFSNNARATMPAAVPGATRRKQ